MSAALFHFATACSVALLEPHLQRAISSFKQRPAAGNGQGCLADQATATCLIQQQTQHTMHIATDTQAGHVLMACLFHFAVGPQDVRCDDLVDS